jgi:hypothetical protein
MSGCRQLAFPTAARLSDSDDQVSPDGIEDDYDDESDSWETVTSDESDEGGKDLNEAPIWKGSTLDMVPANSESSRYNDISTYDDKTVWRLFESTRKSASFHIDQYLKFQKVSPCHSSYQKSDQKHCSTFGMISPWLGLLAVY